MSITGRTMFVKFDIYPDADPDHISQSIEMLAGVVGPVWILEEHNESPGILTDEEIDNPGKCCPSMVQVAADIKAYCAERAARAEKSNAGGAISKSGDREVADQPGAAPGAAGTCTNQCVVRICPGTDVMCRWQNLCGPRYCKLDEPEASHGKRFDK